MPAAHLPDRMALDTVAAELSRSGAAALDASQELLAHYSDTGEARSQRALDTLVDQAAEALRALTDSFADLAGQLQPTRSQVPADPGTTRRRQGTRR